jgi:hypothetical protein
MESPVFDEDLAGAIAGYDDTGEIDAGDVALERCRIADGATIIGGVQLDAEVLDEAEVGVVAGEGEDEVVGDDLGAFGGGEGHVIFRDAGDNCVEVGGDLAVLDAIVDVGEYPVFDVAVHLRAAVDEGYAGSVAPEVEGCDGGGVFAANDEDVEAVVRVGLVVVVLDLGEVFAGDIEVVGKVVVAGCDGEFARAVEELSTEAVGGMDGEVAIMAGDGVYDLVLTDAEFVVLSYLAVVLEGLDAAGFLVWAGEGDVADLEELRRGEEGHVRRVVKEGVAEAALVDEHSGEAGALSLNGACHPGGACAYDQKVCNGGVGGGAVDHDFNLTEAGILLKPRVKPERRRSGVMCRGRRACGL